MPAQTVQLLDYARGCWRHKIALGLIVSFFTIGGIVYSYRLSDLYRAEAVILPVTSSGKGVGGEASSFLSNIPAFMGGSGGGSASANNFMMYLNSQALRIQVVKALNLVPNYVAPGSPQAGEWTEEQKLDWAAQRLAEMVTVSNDRIFVSQVKITAVHGDVEFATRVVRQYLTELQNFITDNSLTQAKHYRLFLEEQLAANKEELLEMGKAVKTFYVRNPVSLIQGEVNVPVAVQEGGKVRSFKNYEEFKKHFEILQRQEIPGTLQKDVRFVKGVPYEVYLYYVTTQQEIAKQNYAGLHQSYQMAKAEEAKQEPSFQVLSDPTQPIYKFYPQRKKIAMISFALGIAAAFGYVFYREFLSGAKRRRLSPVLFEEGNREEVA
ncbi:MAG: hypothetical protein HY609_05900 [Deltaproteobacteria bacterium]|nr:hypothetical protein [Deltaproteobacteria bacterium]